MNRCEIKFVCSFMFCCAVLEIPQCKRQEVDNVLQSWGQSDSRVETDVCQSKQKESGSSCLSVCELNWKGIWGLKHNFWATNITHNIIRWALVLESVTRLEQWAPTMRFPPSCQCVCTFLGNKMPHCEGSTETLLLAALWVGGRRRREGWREGEMER